MWAQRARVRIPKAQSTRLDSNRLSHDLIQRPHSNYGLEIAPEPTGHGLPLSKCEAYNRVYEQPYGSS
jgi:hypothetical protein